ncbi:CGNR zinc finger domain-containing protein [Bacillus cereus]|nr:CGNR zinc finger domain-containing protein [Bacillus cereus]MBE7121486.1 CGNR zinc finger domain-containing protein [Bacillus cereus]
MSQNQEAPNQLEIIREFLNTWRIPNDTRSPIDRFQTVDDVITFREKYWKEEFSFHTLDELKQFREDIRRAVEEQGTLQKWFEKYPFRVCVAENMEDIAYEPIGENNLYTKMLQIILKAINQKQWGRLKTCPDCRWVFYDHSRNGSKRWCGMYAGGEEGRACGTIAKVKNYRAKRKGRSDYNG